MDIVTAFKISSGQHEQFELIDLQSFTPEKFTERQIAILSKNLDGIATLRQKRTLYTAYVKKDGSFGSASKVAK